jgi:hypothetical protein
VRGREGTLERCVPHVDRPPTPYNGPLSNWDLVSPVSDDNGLLKNPLWLFQTPASVGPPKDLAGCLKNRRFDSSCTPPNVTVDAASWAIEVPCGSDFRGIHPGSPVGVDGHVNWVNATYEGLLSWDENSVDHDFNFSLDPMPGTQFPIGSFYFFDGVQWNFEYVDKPIHLEFMSDETIDNFADPWWKSLHDNHPAKDAPLGFALVTGLIGLDCEHDCHIEIHPVYAMAIRVKDDPSDETWAIFVRDFGTEGPAWGKGVLICGRPHISSRKNMSVESEQEGRLFQKVEAVRKRSEAELFRSLRPKHLLQLISSAFSQANSDVSSDRHFDVVSSNGICLKASGEINAER